MAEGASLVPPLAPPRPPRPLVTGERTVGGLRVVAVARRGVPMVEVRLRSPLVTDTVADRAAVEVMGETLLSGAGGLDKVGLAGAIGALGASLGTTVDPETVRVSGSVLSERLPDLLTLLADVLVEPAFPADEVTGEAARLAEHVRIARSQAGVLADEELGRLRFGSHAYGLGLPDPEVLRAVGPEAVRAQHARLGPGTLLLVGDLDVDAMLGAADALAVWRGGHPGTVGPVPEVPELPLRLVDRPGSVQSAIRLGGACPPRRDPAYPTFQLANMVFGGYFSSRLVTNLREEKGYTYSPHSVLVHHAAGSEMLVEADVATEVTGPALVETRAELAGLETVTQQELDDAREYAIGSLAVGTASHAGLATALAGLLASGVGPEFLVEHPQRLREVTVADVRAVDFGRMVTVVVGDEATVAGQL